MIPKQAMMILIMVLLLCLPFVVGVFEASVGPQSNSVGTAQLRTATASSTTDCGVNVDLVMNDFGFFPDFAATAGLCSVNYTLTGQNIADPADTIGRVRLSAPGPGGNSRTVRWRYVTSTDNPYWWICASTVTGSILGTWVSDDPPQIGFVNSPLTILTVLQQPDPLIVCRRITSSDIQAWALPVSSYALADQWIRSHGYSVLNRDFRALQHAAGSLAPSGFLFANLKISLGQVIPTTSLPIPVNLPLP